MNIATHKRSALSGIVAIVDDNPSISVALQMWLSFYKIDAVVHNCAESFLNDIRASGGDLMVRRNDSSSDARLLGAILDVNLPGMTGFELAKSLRELNPSLPLTMITALSELERQEYGTISNSVPCLSKPFDLNVLESTFLPLLH